jgi:hypothetical protein
LSGISKTTRSEPAALAEKINSEHRACERAAKSAVGHAITAGDYLAEAKDQAGHGNFGAWLEANFEGSERTAQTYMKLSRNRDALNPQRASDLSIRGALAELSSPTEQGGESDGRQGAGGMPEAYYTSRQETERIQAQLKRLDICRYEGRLPVVKDGTSPADLELAFRLNEALISQGEMQKDMLAFSAGISREDLEALVMERLRGAK